VSIIELSLYLALVRGAVTIFLS